MTFARTEYIEWARQNYGRAEFDLGISGMKKISLRDFVSLNDVDLDDPSGWRALSNAIARYNDVDVADVIPALGTTNAIWLAYTSAIVNAGDEVLVESPAYEPLVRVAEGIGAKVTRFDRSAGPTFAIDPTKIASAITPRTRILAISNLHNPSGTRTSDDTLIEIARIASKTGTFVLVDEVYAPFDSLTDSRGVFTKSARKLAPNIVAIGSLTKCFGLGDQRIGWLLAPHEIIRRAEDAVTSLVGHLPVSWTNLGTAAFAHIDALAKRAREITRGKRDRVAAWMSSRSDLRWSAPESGLYGFALHGAQRDLRPDIEAGIAKHSVIVAPGIFFGVPGGFRVSWSIERDKLDEALVRLGRVLDSVA